MTDRTTTFCRVKWNFDWFFVAGPSGVVCEVGIGPADLSALQWFTVGANCTRMIGVEPNPEFWPWAETRCELHRCAVGNQPGKADLMLAAGSSAIRGTFLAKGNHVLSVAVQTFDTIDPGDIDVLNIDCEGSERHVLDTLVSRPRLIGIEIWPNDPNAAYNRNALERLGYSIVVSSGPEGETQIWSKGTQP